MKKILTVLFTLLIASSTFADYNTGVNAFNSGDYRTAYKEFLPEANKGNAEAQWAIGMMNYHGNPMQSDISEAAAWFKKAGNQGHSESSLVIANMYFSGEYFDKSKSKSLEWMEKAAEQGSVMAMYKTGLFYARGDTVSQDKIKAKKWFKLAYSQVDSDSKQSNIASFTLMEDIEKAIDRMERGSFDSNIPIRIDLGGIWW